MQSGRLGHTGALGVRKRRQGMGQARGHPLHLQLRRSSPPQSPPRSTTPHRPWFQSSFDYTLFAFVDSTFTCTCQALCK